MSSDGLQKGSRYSFKVMFSILHVNGTYKKISLRAGIRNCTFLRTFLSYAEHVGYSIWCVLTVMRVFSFQFNALVYS